MENNPASSSNIVRKGRFAYVEAFLQGGAPWGFTLKGGLEHGEPLIISKVEYHGKAGLLPYPLEPGDQVITINEVELSGSRQEAISLVKGSYRTLHLTVCRECCSEPFCSEPDTQAPAGLAFGQGPHRERRSCAGGVKLRIKHRRSEPSSRPHSWHSTKLGEGQSDTTMMQISQGSVAPPWPQTYTSSTSTADLSSYETGAYLRKSPDQYSSRGSMESLDQGHTAYSSCHQLSSSKSSNSIDHLHNKRDSAYSSFSTSSSIPEYSNIVPAFTKERSYSMESMLSQRGSEGMRQADIRYVRTVYDAQQGISEEHEVSSSRILRGGDGRLQGEGGFSTSSNSSGGSSCWSLSNRNNFGTLWNQPHGHNSYENLKGVPAPPLRSDSFAAIKNHERPNSWSSLEHTRALRAIQKGSWHSGSPVACGKSLFMAEGQLHTVVEKSPESSPTTKPKQSIPQASQPGRFLLPTGIYPVPQPEPHFAQVPTCCPTSSSMFPALAKESMCSSYKDQDNEVNRTVMVNGNQSNALSTAGQLSSIPQPKIPTLTQNTHEYLHEDPETECGHHRPHFTPTTEIQSQEFSFRQVERRDPYTQVQRRDDRKSTQRLEDPQEQNWVRHNELAGSNTRNPYLEIVHSQKEMWHNDSQNVFDHSKRSCGSFGEATLPANHESEGGTIGKSSRNHGSQRHYSDSDAFSQKQHEHPLTRLENALIQVQQSESPPRKCQSSSERTEVDAIHLSVLEKVSRFEQQQRMSRSRNDSQPAYKPIRPGQSRNSSSCIEDIQARLEVKDSSANHWSHCRTKSCTLDKKDLVCNEEFDDSKSFSAEFQLHGNREALARNPLPKVTDIQRSKSTFHLAEEKNKELLWREDLEDILATIQDTSFNRAYRDCIKDAQAKVLRSTSLRRKDLSANPSVPSKHLSLERNPPKTSPKPAVMSPHTPKERHIVTPEVQKQCPPELPKLPPVGNPVARIGGRKRLTMEQKKRSYSEPENMHEVGLSDGEEFHKKHSQQLIFTEKTSVADRCKLFEMAASRNSSSGPSFSAHRPELKQLQQDALVEYMERKTGRRAIGRSRPSSAYVQALSTDSQSISSGSSFASLQESISNSAKQSDSQLRTTRLSQTLPSGLKPYHFQSGHLPESFSNSSPYNPKHKTVQSEVPFDPQKIPTSEALQSRNQEKVFNGETSRCSGKSTSDEDLLDHSEAERVVPRHFRSRSSPFVEKMYEYLTPGEHRALKRESLPSTASTYSPMGCIQRVENQSPSQVTGREKQRTVEHQRAQSATSLAASVALPCSFSPPYGTTMMDWPSQSLPLSGRDNATHVMVTQSSSDANTSGVVGVEPASAAPPTPKIDSCDSSKDDSQSESPPHTRVQPLVSLRISESSLHFAPSPLFSKEDDDVFLAELNQPSLSVTLQTAPVLESDIEKDLPSPPDPSYFVREEQECSRNPSDVLQIDSRTTTEQACLPSPPLTSDLTPTTSRPSLSLGSVTPPPASCKQHGQGSSAGEEEEEEEELSHSPVLYPRERTAQELRVEVLARALVSRDRSLEPIFNTWAVKSFVELMEDVFPTGHRLPEQQRNNTQTGYSLAEGETTVQERESTRVETDLDEEETDLKQKKEELVEALSLSVASLRGEREALAEEQKSFSTVAGRIEALVQERCKPNEQDKYRMFIGDLDKIVNLLVSLCSRLARVDHTLSTLERHSGDDCAKERDSLQQKRRQLCAQQEDARELKENLDRRQRVVLDILGGYLNRGQLRDYRHWVRARPALLIRQRHLDELLRQGEEQLQRLGESLSPESHRRPSCPAVTSL